VKNGQVRGLGVTTVVRTYALPDVPAIGETVPCYEAVGWYGLTVPKGTPADVISTLEAATRGSIAYPTLRSHLQPLGPGPPGNARNRAPPLQALQIKARVEMGMHVDELRHGPAQTQWKRNSASCLRIALNSSEVRSRGLDSGMRMTAFRRPGCAASTTTRSASTIASSIE